MDAMTTTLDTALQAVIASEATLVADQAAVASIQASIATATAPLGPAQATVATDITTYNANVDAAIAALTASKITA